MKNISFIKIPTKNLRHSDYKFNSIARTNLYRGNPSICFVVNMD